MFKNQIPENVLAQVGGRSERLKASETRDENRKDQTMYQRTIPSLSPRKAARALEQLGMGDLASTLSSIISTGVDITQDPYFPEVICRIQQLAAIQARQPVAACADTPSGLPGGVGLDALIWPLRYYVYAKQNFWVLPLTIFAILYIPYSLGRMSKGG